MNIGCGGMVLRLFVGAAILVLAVGAVVLAFLALVLYG